MPKRTIIVTGASRGIGAGVAKELAKRGFTVACLSRSGDAPEGATDKDAFLCQACDVTDEANIKATFTMVADKCGGIHGLVNNAGIFEEQRSADLALALYDRIMTANATSVMLGCREAYPYLVKSGGGLIVNMGSFWDKLGVSRNIPYCASKAAIGAITRCLAVEWARKNIRVLDVAPGFIDTDFNRDFFAKPENQEWLNQRAPTGKPGKVEDVAKFVGSLFADDIPFLTGETIYLDGGQSITQ